MTSISGCFVLLVVTLAVVSAEDNAAIMKERFDNWKTCHPGYNAFTPEQLEKNKKCDDMNIKDHNCYLSCIRYENGMVGSDGLWKDEVAAPGMAKMWDNTPAAQLSAKQWYRDTRKCITRFERRFKWPKDYTKTCPEIESVKLCVQSTRNC